MPVRKHNESLQNFAIRSAWETGHFWSPDNPDGLNVVQSDLDKLTLDDPVVVQALISYSKMDESQYTKAVWEHHKRAPAFDGIVGPAMRNMLNAERCPVPDFIPPPGVAFSFDDPDLQQVVSRMQRRQALASIGSGNWPSCHNIGNFHCASVGIDDRLLPTFLQPIWLQVLSNVRKAYAEVGLLWKFIKDGKDVLSGESFTGIINTAMSFVNSFSGWIGLAIVGQSEGCGSQIWCKFLNTYHGGSDPASIITQWTTLLKHELGHNCGRSHTNGGVMNPSIVNNLPTLWTPADPSTAWLKQQFGGVPVPIPGDTPIPPAPGPPGTIEQRLRSIEISDTVQNVSLDWCVTEIRRLKGEIP